MFGYSVYTGIRLVLTKLEQLILNRSDVRFASERTPNSDYSASMTSR